MAAAVIADSSKSHSHTMARQAGPHRVALIGYGYSGATFHAPLLNAEPMLELTHVASSNPTKVLQDLPGITVVPNYDDVVRSPDIDICVIATPNDTHCPIARAALVAGKHVVVDKPFTIDLSEARELVALADSRDLLLSVFHNRRWDSDYLSTVAAIQSGHLGRIVHFESHFDRFRPDVRKRWRERPGRGSGIWLDLGPHLIDQAMQLFGIPNAVQASFAEQRDGASTPDWAHVILEYNRLRVVLNASMLAAGGTARFVVHGDAGTFVKRHLDQQEDQLRAGLRPGSAGWGEDTEACELRTATGKVLVLNALAGDQRRFYASFARSLQGEPLDVPGSQAIAVMAVLNAAEQASLEGRRTEPQLTATERAMWPSTDVT